GAANELPSVLQAMRTRKCLGPHEKIGLFGFSAGGSAVLFALAEKRVPVQAAVTVSAPTGLTTAIDALERATKHHYAWNPQTREIAMRSDPQHRAREVASGDPPPALLLFHGGTDTVIPPQSTRSLSRVLTPYYHASGNDKRLKLAIAKGVSHNWTE